MICVKTGSLDVFFQIAKRLFPFKRGLLHSYWAPNFWALYSFADKSLSYYYGIKIKTNQSAVGLTQDVHFDVLPEVSAKFVNTLLIALSLVFISKSLVERAKLTPKYRNTIFLQNLIASSLIFFNFGFHVHEKAFIKISLLWIILVLKRQEDKLEPYYIDWFAIAIGIFCQMPLIHSTKDYLIKITIVLAYIILLKIFIKRKSLSYDLFTIGIFLIDFIVTFNKQIVTATPGGEGGLFPKIISILGKYEFLPLMLFSVVNGLVVQLIFIKGLKD
jgi:alpha-1,3-glucosyltransferase